MSFIIERQRSMYLMISCLPQTPNLTTTNCIPNEGYVRLRDFVGRGNAFPISRSAYHSGVKAGRYPAPLHIGKLAVLPVDVARALIVAAGGSK